MDETKLCLCFEATNAKAESVYLIYSANLSNSPPKFTFERSISGVSSVGCGVLGSKIVFAGGVYTTEEKPDYNRGLITYDTVTKQVSTSDFPHMRGRKYKPLVFDLYGRLYVIDTSDSVYKRTCEVYYPLYNIWEKVDDPFCNRSNARLGSKGIAGRTPFSWFVYGNTVSISSPSDRYTYFHHARQMCKCFTDGDNEPLPFHGMATTYWKRGSFDVVVISFSKGEVGGEGLLEGRVFKYFPRYFSEPQPIFRTDPYEKPDGEVSSYFAECKNGKFCLTTFDNLNIHVYIFEIDRKGNSKGPLQLFLNSLKVHKYNYNDFSREGITSVTVSGCFVLPRPRDDETKRSKKPMLYDNFFSVYESRTDDLDLPAVVKTAEGFKIDPEYDSGGADSDFEDY